MKIIVLLLLILFLTLICTISNCQDDINVPSGYYGLKRVKKFQQYSNNIISPNSDLPSHYLYYPDICKGAYNNSDGTETFSRSSFPGSPTHFANLYIIKGSKMIFPEGVTIYDDYINILCIEGSLEISPRDFFYAGAIVILPGGSLISKSAFDFMDLDTPLIDPFNFFPGILCLGGSLSLIGDNIIKYSAQRLSKDTLYVPDLPDTSGYYINIFSESFINGQQCQFQFNISNSNLLLLGCQPIPESDLNIFFYFSLPQSRLPSIGSSFSSKGGSIYITGNSNVHIENFYLNSLGRTTNQEYNDTQLVFSSSDNNTITEIIIGTNQRYRNSLYIEFSNNVTIKNTVIFETIESRAPVVFLSSNPILSGNLICSKSGSSIIAAYGTEFITSINNSFFRSSPTLTVSETNNPLPISMDYGYEGNGIFSLSPNVLSTSDVFVGHLNAFKFNFISNRAYITGFDYDVYAPFYGTTSPISNLIQYPVDFKIKNPNFVYNSNNSQTSQIDRVLLNINNNNINSPVRSFSINDLTATDPIIVNIQDNSLTLLNLKATDRFKINGVSASLDIIDSSFSLLNNTGVINIVSSSLSIINTYIKGLPNSINPTQSQSIYSSVISPYYYTIPETINQFKILSIFPNKPYQMNVNTIIHISVQFELVSQILINDILCVFTSVNGINTTVPVDSNSLTCALPLLIKREGTLSLRVEIRNKSSSDTHYLVDFPNIEVFSYYGFYSGWKIVSSIDSSNSKTIVDGNTFQNGCQSAINNNCTLTNAKFSNLPNVTNSNELNTLFSSGITTEFDNQAASLRIPIDSNTKKYQIQLFFTYYQPIDQYTSLLSVYIENQPVFLLEPLINAPSFKNITFFYDNDLSLSTVNLSFISRGDAYLTSLAIYSSFFIPSEPSTSNITSNHGLTIGLSVGLPVLFIASLLFCLFYYRNNIKKILKSSKNPKDDLESCNKEMESITTEGQDNTPTLTSASSSTNSNSGVSSTSQDKNETPPSPSTTPSVSIAEETCENSNEINKLIIKSNNESRIPIKRTGPFPSEASEAMIKLITNQLSNVYSSHKEKYRTDKDILLCMQESHYYRPNDPTLPLIFSETTLDFGLNGMKCKIDTPYLDTLVVTNDSDYEYTILVIFPTEDSNPSGMCSSDKSYFKIRPHSTEYINVVVTLTCTTNYFEKFALSIEELKCHTFFHIHMESELSTKLDYRDLVFNEFIGEGTFGVVYKGQWKNQTVAIKLMKISIINLDEVQREMSLLEKLRHPNIVSYVGSVVNSQHLCIVTEFMPIGCLGDLIHNSSIKLSMKQKIRFVLDIARACQFLHSSGILHRDLKPDNVLVVDTNVDALVCVKITDFGTSRETNERYSNFGKLTNQVGTPIYMSNQILEQKAYDASTDVYSFAVLFYELIIEETPFGEITNVWDIPKKVVEGWRPSIGLDNLDTDITALINRCWAPNNRPTFTDIIAQLEIIINRYN